MTNVFPYDTDTAPPFLKGQTVYLQPACEKDRESIRPLAKDPRLWEFTKTLLIDDTYDIQFDDYFDEALNLPQLCGRAFVIRTTADNTIIGMSRFFNVSWKDKRLEIGHTWYIPGVWGKVYNKECKLLLLQYAFEQLHLHRVEFRVAHQNIRSQRAVEKIGGIKEGVLRKFAIRNDGSRRDTVVFSIIDDEWPEKKEKLQRMVAAGL
ncbi:MAG TPA: GNAT family protein [Puia sp.]|nr:GNAT family protein [Puia sp.]